MTTNPFSQLHNPFLSLWTETVEKNLKQWNEAMDQLAKMETESVDRMTAAVDETAKLAKAGLKASLQMQSEWRRVALEAARSASTLRAA
ncbi:MAG: hypothetical protein H6721_16890 [Sandaracinus sp.]|nr:hypothetical protein [Myxococcales bacterium]MCB9601416.1 hypothetical protein [Sandaracinus sp.]MCB9611688.1 hypothetical protein [Sandaracinus sp.]MCB9625225.1 hypothetical protein [Sandaracinus sp.]MCB9633796.1 hypothetical protein [Sandaracinus sp.]